VLRNCKRNENDLLQKAGVSAVYGLMVAPCGNPYETLRSPTQWSWQNMPKHMIYCLNHPLLGGQSMCYKGANEVYKK
jgi:hypothetical protein